MKRQKRKLDDREETYYVVLDGHCGSCKTKVSKVIGSNCTPMSNGDRFHYPNETAARCIFRCEGCENVICDTWVCGDPPQDHCSPPKRKTYRLTQPYFSKYREVCGQRWISEGDTVFKHGDHYLHECTGIKFNVNLVEVGNGFAEVR